MTRPAETAAETPEVPPTQPHAAEDEAPQATATVAIPVPTNGQGAWAVGRLSIEEAEKHAARFRPAWEVGAVAAPNFAAVAPSSPAVIADAPLPAPAVANDAPRLANAVAPLPAPAIVGDAPLPATATAAVDAPLPATATAAVAAPLPATAASTAPLPATATERPVPVVAQTQPAARATRDADASGKDLALPMSRPSRNPLLWAAGAAVLLLLAGGTSIVLSSNRDDAAATAAAIGTVAPPITAPIAAAPVAAAPFAAAPIAAAHVAAAPVAPPPPAPRATAHGVAPHVAPASVHPPPESPRHTPIAAAPRPSAAPTTVRVQVRVSPASATLSFDGMRVRPPYDVRLTMSHTTHRLEASLPGYQTAAQPLELSRDRQITITLLPNVPARPVATQHPQPPTARHPPPHRGTGFVSDNPFD